MVSGVFNELFTNFGLDQDYRLFYFGGSKLMNTDQQSESDEVILEFTAIGSVMRVCAIDPASLTEVVVQGPVGADRAVLGGLARQKLAFVMARHGISGSG